MDGVRYDMDEVEVGAEVNALADRGGEDRVSDRSSQKVERKMS